MLSNERSSCYSPVLQEINEPDGFRVTVKEVDIPNFGARDPLLELRRVDGRETRETPDPHSYSEPA